MYMNLKQRIKEYNADIYPQVIDSYKKLRQLYVATLADDKEAKLLLIGDIIGIQDAISGI